MFINIINVTRNFAFILILIFFQYNFVTPLTSMVVTKPEAKERTDEGEGIYNLLLKQFNVIYEPVREKTNNLHRRKQRRRSASR